jgi:hypothetical protein
MQNNDEIVDKFWAKMRRADMDQSKLEYGFETRVLAQIREQQKKKSLSLLQLASRFCLASLCALLLLGLYLPTTVNAIEFSSLVQTVSSNDESADVASMFANGDAQ